MRKLNIHFLSIAAIFILLTLVSCHLPGRTSETTSTLPAEDTSTTGESTSPAGDETSPPVGPTNTDGAETILIPAGSFWMGSEQDDELAKVEEKPFHLVTLEAFHLYTHEVTNEMYAACVDAGVCAQIGVMQAGPTRHYADPAFAEFPVVGVDWNMADDYCTWASGRLPTEAEWEYAARGLESLLYPWGAEDPACDRLNMFGCEVPPDTVAVGSYLLGNSPFAVWDMAGNVWEWVHDWYAEGTYALSAADNPLGPYSYQDAEHPLKVVRGGGLYSEPNAVRSAKRSSADPLRAFDDVGFRCVAEGELSLPDGYTPVPEGHEFVPPDPLEGDGEHVEDYDPDPDVFFEIRWIGFGCPTLGQIMLAFDISASGPVTFTASVDGVPFDCRIDPDPSGLPVCSGPIPDAYGVSDSVVVEWHFEGEGIDVSGAWPVPLPEGCEGSVPRTFSTSIDCPVRGMVTVIFEYTPPIVWDTIQLDGSDVPCWPLGEGQMNCIVPERAPGDSYIFRLHGTDAEGNSIGWSPMVDFPSDCPVQLIFNVDVQPLCFEDHQTVQVMYEPVTEVLSSVTADGVPLSCIGMAPGVQICGDIPGDPGSPTMVTACFEGLDCLDYPLTVPACPATTTIPGAIIEPTCYPPGSPGVSLHYWPFDEPIADANANGVWLTCDNMGGGYYLCSGLPGSPGDVKTITFCPPDFACFGGDVIVPACADEELHWLTFNLRCQEEANLAFEVDTLLDWLVPGAAFTYSATDGSSSYACTVNPTHPGYLQCSGPWPVDPGPLTICVQRDGDPTPLCHTWTGWAPNVAIVHPCTPEEAPDWRLASVGCYDATHLFFIADTNLAWLVPGAGFTYSAQDGFSTYNCDVHPTFPGRLYCVGPRPTTPGPLTLCVHQDGAPLPTCIDFAGWPGYVAAIPSCAPEEPPPPPVPTCADYTTPTECGAHSCYWNKITSTCSSTP